VSRVFKQQGRGTARAARIFSDFSPQSLADSHQPLARRSLEAFAVCRSRHPAAKRLVQRAFSIGVPMRKASSVSVIQAPHLNTCWYYELKPAVPTSDYSGATRKLIARKAVAPWRRFGGAHGCALEPITGMPAIEG